MISANIKYYGEEVYDFAIERRSNSKTQNILAYFTSYACSQIAIMTNMSAVLLVGNMSSVSPACRKRRNNRIKRVAPCRLHGRAH